MEQSFSLIQVMIKGGWTLGILVLLSIIALAVALERWWTFRKTARPGMGLRRALGPGRTWRTPQEFLLTVEREPSIPAMAIAAGLRAFLTTSADPRSVMEREAKAHFLILENRLAFLGTVGNIAPYIGLFGTVLGIIRAFRDLAQTSTGGAAVVSQGIAEALVSTAAGLFVAVMASVSYNMFQTRLDRIARETELVIDEAMDHVSGAYDEAG